MKKILDIKDNNLKPDDIMIYDGKQWITVSKGYFLGELNNKLVLQQQQITTLQKQLADLQKQVSELAIILKGVI